MTPSSNVMPDENPRLCISITSGPMELILCSFVVLVSTPKPQNMKCNGRLVFEKTYDFISDLQFCLMLGYYLIHCRSLAFPELVEVPNF